MRGIISENAWRIKQAAVIIFIRQPRGSIEAAKDLVEDLKQSGFQPQTLGGNKGYHTNEFISFLQGEEIRTHITARKNLRTPGLDGRTTRHDTYQTSQRIRKRVEEIFGWMKTTGGFRRTRSRGRDPSAQLGHFVAAAYNLLRIGRLERAGCLGPRREGFHEFLRFFNSLLVNREKFRLGHFPTDWPILSAPLYVARLREARKIGLQSWHSDCIVGVGS